MTRTPLIFLCGAAAALAGCGRHWSHREYADGDSGPLKVVTSLQCPDHQNSLTRVRVAPDGMSCDYAGPRGSEVTLRLVKPADGDDSALASLDGEVDALMPEVKGKVEQASAKVEAASDDSDDGDSSTSSKGEKADIDLPGFHLHAQGDKAQIRMPGVSIDADGDKSSHGGSSHDGSAHVSVGNGMVDVRARNEAAIVRVRERRHGVNAEYRLADKNGSPAGWRVVGYEARGPAGGPLVVAVVKSKDSDEDDLFHDAKRLVRANVGG